MQQTDLIIIYGIVLHFNPMQFFFVPSPPPCAEQSPVETTSTKSIFCPATHNKSSSSCRRRPSSEDGPQHTFVMSLHILLAIIKLPFRNSQPVSVGSLLAPSITHTAQKIDLSRGRMPIACRLIEFPLQRSPELNYGSANCIPTPLQISTHLRITKQLNGDLQK